MDPETYWWSLTDARRAALERAVDHIVYHVYRGNRAAVLALVATARTRGLDSASDTAAAVLWLIREKVAQDG